MERFLHFHLVTDLPNKKWGNTSSVGGINGDFAITVVLVMFLCVMIIAIRVREALRQDSIEEEKERQQIRILMRKSKKPKSDNS